MSGRRTGLRAAGLVVLAAVVAGVGAGVAIHALNSGGGSSRHDNPPGLHGQATWEPGEKPAPGFRLEDQSGRAISLASLRGRSVVLAFFSSRCRLACAREARTLRVALRPLPAPARPVLVIVSLDPSHDTPQSARRAVARWGLPTAAGWHWLLGSRGQLAPVWEAYRVEGGRTDEPATGTTPVYLIDRSGFERAGLLYPFPPGWPAGDLRNLAREG
jgi:cytochrome oxidase Cu insertion factor (SCO1/SenC/PrrC family)